MKRKIITLLLLFYYSISFSQNKIYLDENMKIIDSVFFKKKCKTLVLKCLTYKTDSVEVNKVLKKYEFGKISETQYHQLRKLFIQNRKTSIDSSSTLLVHYKDSLYDFKANKRIFDIHVKSHDSVRHHILTPKKFDSNRKKRIKKQLKCVKKMKRKYNAETFYIYKYDYGSIKTYPDLNWIKDRSIFKNVFFKIMYNSDFLILKPNGDYFLSGGHLDTKMIKTLIKTKNWDKYKKDLENSISAQSKEGIGFFKENTYHKSHCF